MTTTAAGAGPVAWLQRQAGGAMSRSRLGHVTRQLGVLSVSLVVTGTVALYLVTPVPGVWALTSTVRSIPGNAIVFYGKVANNRRSPVAGVRVEISSKKAGPHPWKFNEVTHTRANGTYRMKIDPPRGTYVVSFTKHYQGKWFIASRGVIARDGHAYDVSVRLQLNGSFLFIPLFTY
jgi:hypothetical protein